MRRSATITTPHEQRTGAAPPALAETVERHTTAIAHVERDVAGLKRLGRRHDRAIAEIRRVNVHQGAILDGLHEAVMTGILPTVAEMKTHIAEARDAREKAETERAVQTAALARMEQRKDSRANSTIPALVALLAVPAAVLFTQLHADASAPLFYGLCAASIAGVLAVIAIMRWPRL